MVLLNKYYSRLKQKKKLVNPLTIYFATDAHVKIQVDGDETAGGASLGNRYFYTAGQKMQHFVDIVNEESMDLLYFGGDMIENWTYTGSAELFMEKWNQINPNIKKELTIGNHDLAGGEDVANTEMADVYGYGDRPLIAGSKYNQSFYVENENVKIKIISVDTNLDENGSHIVSSKQVLKKPVRDWMESELLNSTVDIVLILSHGGIADDKYHFDETDQLEFKNMIDNVASINPNLNMYHLFGHNHRQGVMEYNSLGDNIKSYSIPPVVDFETGKYVVVKISEAGIDFEINDLYYPYP